MWAAGRVLRPGFRAFGHDLRSAECGNTLGEVNGQVVRASLTTADPGIGQLTAGPALFAAFAVEATGSPGWAHSLASQ